MGGQQVMTPVCVTTMLSVKGTSVAAKYYNKRKLNRELLMTLSDLSLNE